MKRILVAVLLSTATGRAAAEPVRVPVLIELFTSEGCSSCPPADALVARYLRDQPIRGAEIVALSEHVDYWDDLGWRDPFSAPSFTERQRSYARRLHSGIYTPQLVVGGARHLVGSRDAQARAAIAAAASEVRGTVSAREVPGRTGVLDITARWPDGADAEILVALVRDHATTHVPRGENAGRTLEHVAVVRALYPVGAGVGAFSGRVSTTGAPDADRAVVFVQERNGGRVHGVALVELHRR